MANGVVEGLPAWLKPALFLQADFDAEEYVSYLRRFVSASQPQYMVHVCQGVWKIAQTCNSSKWQVPLETLSTELQRYVTVLKGKLVEVINEDYNDFVSLSTKLVNVDGAVTQMQKPLLMLKVHMLQCGTIQQPMQVTGKPQNSCNTCIYHLHGTCISHLHVYLLPAHDGPHASSQCVCTCVVQERLSAAQEAVQAELTALNQGLQKRQQAAKVKALLELMQDTAHVMSKASPSMVLSLCCPALPCFVTITKYIHHCITLRRKCKFLQCNDWYVYSTLDAMAVAHAVLNIKRTPEEA